MKETTVTIQTIIPRFSYRAVATIEQLATLFPNQAAVVKSASRQGRKKREG